LIDWSHKTKDTHELVWKNPKRKNNALASYYSNNKDRIPAALLGSKRTYAERVASQKRPANQETLEKAFKIPTDYEKQLEQAAFYNRSPNFLYNTNIGKI